jgi:hypothetical protein
MYNIKIDNNTLTYDDFDEFSKMVAYIKEKNINHNHYIDLKTMTYTFTLCE